MRRFRKLLLTLGITVALLLPLAGAASADPGDGGGFTDPTIQTPANTVNIIGPAGGAVVTPNATSTATDPGDGGGF